ncbi:MAG: hypothetical protein P1R58_12635 [bacterium]|nr:hypothetical protein [bacterium]
MSCGFYFRWGRIHYEAGLLVEYLSDVKGYPLETIMADSVRHDAVLNEMLKWGKTEPTNSIQPVHSGGANLPQSV